MNAKPLALALGALALGTAAAAAEPLPPTHPIPMHVEDFSLEQLERAFWLCDYMATTQGMDSTPIVACRFVTDELKKQKFGGSFRELLAWWSANKRAEYDRIERSH
jgi:hypothetical protein